MSQKYFGRWDSLEGVRGEFTDMEWDSEYTKQSPKYQLDNFPTEDEMLFAAYGGGAYEGEAFVVFDKDGQLFEVNGGHCSCYGLEDQWKPEATTWGALAMRPKWAKDDDYGMDDHDPEAYAAFRALLHAHVPAQP